MNTGSRANKARNMLAALGCALLLAACGGSDGTQATEPATPVPGAATLGAAGGSVASAEGVRVTVPAGALVAGTTIRIAKDSTGSPPWGVGLTEVGDIYALTPHGVRFDTPVEVRLPIPEALRGTDGTLTIAKAESGSDRWTVLDNVQRDGDNLVTQVDSFSFFRVIRVRFSATPFAVEKTVTACNPGQLNPFGPSVPGCIADANVALGLRLQTSGNTLPVCDVRSPAQVSVTAYPVRNPANFGNSAFRFDRIVLLDKHELTGNAPVDGSPRPPIPQTIDLSAALVPWVGHPYIWIEVTTDCFALGPPGPFSNSQPGFVPVSQQWGGAIVAFSSETVAQDLIGINGTFYAPLRWVKQPGAPAGVEGQALTLTGVLTGGASLGNAAAGGIGGLTAPAALPVRPATALDSATVDWERSDDGGQSWRTTARSWEHEANPDPFASGRAWRYWGVGAGLRSVTIADADALFRGRACYTLPGRTPTCTLSDSFRLAVAAQGGAPAFGTVSASQLVRDGQTASFTAVATGLPAPTLQWRRLRPGAANYEDIAGATAATYTTDPASLADNGTRYRVVASNGVGTAASVEITLSVSAVDVAPTVLTQPSPLTVGAGSEAVFAVDARGTEGLSYQWRKDGVAITGANSAVLKLAAVDSGSAGVYSVVISNGAGSQTSAGAALTVSSSGPAPSAPSITTQPAAVTVNTGSTAAFGVGVSGSGPLSYQWRKDGTPISGATAAVLTLAGASGADQGSYTVVVGNGTGSITSNAATLTVNAGAAPTAPSISTQPSSLAVLPGTGATLAVAASGSGPLAFQWSKDGLLIPGATGPVFRIGVVSGADGGSYAVTVSNAAGNVSSSAATLIVIGAPAVTGQPAGTSATVGSAATFSVVASGDVPNYQWTRDNIAIGGANGASYTTPALTLSDNGAVYGVVVYNGAGLVFSQGAILTVTAAPIVAASTLASVAAGGGAPNNRSSAPSLSADGGLVAFRSDGTNLVAGTTGFGHAYLRNLATNTTSLINARPNGAESTRGVGNLKLAANGRHAVFTSFANDLVAGDSNVAEDVFLRDLVTGTTTRLNVLPSGAQDIVSGNSSGAQIDISADGRWVLMSSGVDLAGDGASLPNGPALFLRDTENGTTRAVPGLAGYGAASLSASGRFVVVANGIAGFNHLQVYDIQANVASTEFSVSSANFPDGILYRPRISDDGQVIAFGLRDSTRPDYGTYNQIAVYDRGAQPGFELTLQSETNGEAVGDYHSSDPELSGDGRYVVFRTHAPNLSGDAAATVRPYLIQRDRQTRTITVVSRRVDRSNVWVDNSSHALSRDGAAIAFVADMVDMFTPGRLGETQVFVAPSP